MLSTKLYRLTGNAEQTRFINEAKENLIPSKERLVLECIHSMISCITDLITSNSPRFVNAYTDSSNLGSTLRLKH